MIKQEIKQDLKQHANARGIPIYNPRQWAILNDKYEKEDIKDSIINYIVTEQPEFPISETSYQEMVKSFHSMKKADLSEFQIHNNHDVAEKFDYKYDYPKHGIGVIDSNNTYNAASDYFFNDIRMGCPSWGYKSPKERWYSGEQMNNTILSLWRMGNDRLTEPVFRTGIRLGAYIATQFKPAIARYMYDIADAKDVLDTSVGWGDRLAAFYASNAETYTGCDPNNENFNVYIKQCIEYEKLLGTDPERILLCFRENYFSCRGKKKVRIFRSAAEDVEDFGRKFDILFTSPPYFCTEKYAEGSPEEKDQSWSRYADYTQWRDKFLFPMLEKSWSHIRENGHIALNIIDPKIKSRRYKCCDELVEFMTEQQDAMFLGQLGMRMSRRPKKMKDQDALHEHLSEMFIEPIWIFQKKGQGVPFNFFKNPNPSLEMLF